MQLLIWFLWDDNATVRGWHFMQMIKEHIRLNKYKPVYLLYGSEDYLKKLYKKKLTDAMIGSNNDLNYSYFEGNSIDLNQLMAQAETMPFLSDRRLIVVENSGLFKMANDLGDYIKEMSLTTHIIFIEHDIDKRNRLYKVVKDLGTISEMNGLDQKNLVLWMVSILKKSNKKATQQTLEYLLEKSGSDMKDLENELEKLICYKLEDEIIETTDIDAICSTQVTGKIFQMIDAIGAKKQKEALQMYYDLLTLREKPMSILYLMMRHFNILFQVKDYIARSLPRAELSQKVGIPPFTVNKYMTQAKNFTVNRIRDAIETCNEVEEQVKTGKLGDQIGVELLIVEFSQSKEGDSK